MSKSKYGNSNLYMTTREFADLVVAALEEQNYFKRSDVAHPQDIAYAFTTVAETIGTTMGWAISQELNNKKNAVMQSGDLQKNNLDPKANEYSEWKFNK
jgi:putative N-acetylmannosamine-6-phosphate epimerase